MDKDKSEINSAATDRQECDRQLRAMGFDVDNRPDSHNEDDAEDAGMLVDSVIGCLGFVFQEINDAESFSGEDFYKLTRDENEIFNKLPEWHRELFIHFPGEWSVTEKIFEEKNLKNKNLSVNQLLIKCSLKAILAGDEVACYLWDLSEDMKEIDCMSDEMDLREISAVVFPLYAYQGIAEDFERSAVRAFRKERISIDELGRKVGYSLELADIGVLVNQIWKRYLDDKKEYIGMYRQSVMNTVFNNKKSEPDAMTPPPPPEPLPDLAPPELPPEPAPPPQKKTQFTIEKEKYRRAIYQEVVNEMGVLTNKGILVDEAAKRAECSEKMIREALKASE